jgi:hypothetical protein
MKIDRRSNRRIEREGTSIPGKAYFFLAGRHTTTEVLIINVTYQGAGVLLSKPLRIGQMLRVKFAMPRKLRCYDVNELEYEIWGVVRFVGQANPEVSKPHLAKPMAARYEIGIAFSGKQPPPQYLADPETLFDIKPVPRRDGLWSLRRASRIPDW